MTEHGHQTTSSNSIDMARLIANVVLFLLPMLDVSTAFRVDARQRRFASRRTTTTTLLSSDKTYGVAPIKDVIDAEGAMACFFQSREEWLPLFRTVAGSAMPDDTAALLSSFDIEGTSTSDTSTTIGNFAFDFDEESSPWRRRSAIPQDEEERKVIASFLDAMQASLLAIPVNEVLNPESTDDDDENDLQFVEEGRRLLALGRFQVLRANQGGSVESVFDALFARCWSEVIELSQSGTAHSGSLILVPDYELSDLRRFVDMNLIKPLEWLGVDADFEVVSLQRDSPAIRLIYKLNDIPTGTYTEEDGFAASE